MKKNTLVQLVVIYLGLSSIYLATSYLAQYLYFLVAAGSESFSYRFNTGSLFSYLVIVILGVIVIFKSGSLSKFISDRAGLDDSLTVFSTPRQLLSILLVVTAVAHLLDYLPSITKDILSLFIDNIPKRVELLEVNKSGSAWVLSALHIVFPCLVIIFARNLTDYFAKNIIQDDEEMVAVQDTVQLDIQEENEGAQPL
ncbi:MAG TPA: hypothetical protein VG738_02545 [Chitinophagaceae bacterium]|nr:hypothetical protein [Chitinophagaceae bacterium]